MRAIGLILLLLSAPAWAQEGGEPVSEANVGTAALAAAQVHEEHCADTRGNDVSVFGTAMAQVSGALVSVSETYDATQDPSLLFWRGLLAICVGREDVGAIDLQTFLEGVDGQSAYADQIRDANRRLRRVFVTQERAPTPPRNPGGAVLGAGLVAGAGAFAGLSGWQADRLRAAEESVLNDGLQGATLDEAWDDGGDSADRANAFLGASIGLATGSLVSFIITAATADKGPDRAAWKAPAPVVAAAPTNTGVQITVGGEW